MDLTTLERLRTPAGAALLTEAQRAYGVEDAFALGVRLRRDHPVDVVAAALTLARLRQRAVAKFDPADAARMFFTVDGYEQATRAVVARHRAIRIAASSAGEPVADLCCGIGGDLVAMARAGLEVTGVEADPLTAAMAEANVETLGLERSARIVTADATEFDRTGFPIVTCDPARRTARGRTFDPDAYRPPWPFVVTLLAGSACVKVAPGIPHDRVPGGVEAEWVSDRGEVKEAALWSGRFVGSGVSRRATLLPAGASITDADDPGPSGVGAPGRFLYEPDGAVIRAGLVTAVSAGVAGWLLDPTIAYISSDRAARTPFARAYEVIDVLPYDVKVLRDYLRARHIGVVTIKKRGVDVAPEALRRSLRPSGTAEMTLVVTRVSRRATVLAVRPIP